MEYCEDAQRVTSAQVREVLGREAEDYGWSKKTHDLMMAYVGKLTEVYGESWYVGVLSRDQFFSILLPEHRHNFEEKKGYPVSFPLDTSLADAVTLYKECPERFAKECYEHIAQLKEKIHAEGFKTTVALVVIDGLLKHVDGLHRLIALGSLLDEGVAYEPIGVFVCCK